MQHLLDHQRSSTEEASLFWDPLLLWCLNRPAANKTQREVERLLMQHIWVYSWMRHIKAPERSQTFGLRWIFTYKFMVVSYSYSSLLWRGWNPFIFLQIIISSLPNCIRKTLGHYKKSKSLFAWSDWENVLPVWKEFAICSRRTRFCKF